MVATGIACPAQGQIAPKLTQTEASTARLDASHIVETQGRIPMEEFLHGAAGPDQRIRSLCGHVHERTFGPKFGIDQTYSLCCRVHITCDMHICMGDSTQHEAAANICRTETCGYSRKTHHEFTADHQQTIETYHCLSTTTRSSIPLLLLHLWQTRAQEWSQELQFRAHTFIHCYECVCAVNHQIVLSRAQG